MVLMNNTPSKKTLFKYLGQSERHFFQIELGLIHFYCLLSKLFLMCCFSILIYSLFCSESDLLNVDWQWLSYCTQDPHSALRGRWRTARQTGSRCVLHGQKAANAQTKKIFISFFKSYSKVRAHIWTIWTWRAAGELATRGSPLLPAKMAAWYDEEKTTFQNFKSRNFISFWYYSHWTRIN